MDIREMILDIVDWIHLAQDRKQGSCGYDNKLSSLIKFWEILDYVSCWRFLKE
jgi:hypothetical protein